MHWWRLKKNLAQSTRMRKVHAAPKRLLKPVRPACTGVGSTLITACPTTRNWYNFRASAQTLQSGVILCGNFMWLLCHVYSALQALHRVLACCCYMFIACCSKAPHPQKREQKISPPPLSAICKAFLLELQNFPTSHNNELCCWAMSAAAPCKRKLNYLAFRRLILFTKYVSMQSQQCLSNIASHSRQQAG